MEAKKTRRKRQLYRRIMKITETMKTHLIIIEMTARVLTGKGWRGVSRRCESESLPLHPRVAPNLFCSTLVSLARPVPLLMAGYNWCKVLVRGVARLCVAVTVLHVVRRLAVRDADMCARSHHTVTCTANDEINVFEKGYFMSHLQTWSDNHC